MFGDLDWPPNGSRSFVSISWSSCLQRDRAVHVTYAALLCVLRWHIARYVPIRQVATGNRPPSHITPVIQSLLSRRNKLQRKGKTAQADSITKKVVSLIQDFQSRRLSNVNIVLTHVNCVRLWRMLIMWLMREIALVAVSVMQMTLITTSPMLLLMPVMTGKQ